MIEKNPSTLKEAILEKDHVHEVLNTIHLEVGTMRGIASGLFLEPGDIIKIVTPNYIQGTLLAEVNGGTKGIAPGYPGPIVINPSDLEKIHVSERES